MESDGEPPMLATIGPKVAVIGQTLQFTIHVSDLDQDPLEFNADNMAAGSTLFSGVIYGDAVFTWTPTAAEAGSRDITIIVTDSAGGTDSQSFHVVVRAANTAPVMLPVGNRIVAENALLDLQLAANDPDSDVLTWSASNLPPGAVLDPVTGRLQWQTNYFSAGTYNGIVLTVSDGSASSTETIGITVAPTNQAPKFSALPPLGTQEKNLLQFNLVAGDADGDGLIYAPLSTLPQGAEFDGSNGRFTWIPSYNQAGDYTFTFTASDAYGAQDILDVKVSVADVNRVPILTFTNHQVALAILNFVVTGSDADIGEFEFRFEGSPRAPVSIPSAAGLCGRPAPPRSVTISSWYL
jgi:hypothetical protein